MALADLDTLKARLKITIFTEDDLLDAMIASVSTLVENYLNRKIESAKYTYTVSGRGNQAIALPQSPIKSIKSLTIDGTAIPQSTGVNVAGYVFDNNMLYLRGSYTFNRGIQNIAVVYVVGYDIVPEDIQEAVLETVSLRYTELSRIGHVSKSLQGDNVTFFIGDFTPMALTILNQYKRVVPV